MPSERKKDARPCNSTSLSQASKKIMVSRTLCRTNCKEEGFIKTYFRVLRDIFSSTLLDR